MHAPGGGEGKGGGHEGPEITGKTIGVGEEFLNAAGQRVGAADAVDGHAINGLADRIDVLIGTQPVLGLHPVGNVTRFLWQRRLEISEQGINPGGVGWQGRLAITGPRAGEQVVVKEIDEDASDAPAGCADASAAADKSLVAFSEAIDCPVQGDAGSQRGGGVRGADP